jgi:hypothetical protein
LKIAIDFGGVILAHQHNETIWVPYSPNGGQHKETQRQAKHDLQEEFIWQRNFAWTKYGDAHHNP